MINYTLDLNFQTMQELKLAENVLADLINGKIKGIDIPNDYRYIIKFMDGQSVEIPQIDNPVETVRRWNRW